MRNNSNRNNSTQPLDAQIYHKVADETMQLLLTQLEKFADLNPKLDMDVECAAGVLELDIDHGKSRFVLNKQAPNLQLWLSSPIRGPLRYDFDTKDAVWYNNRDRHLLLPCFAEDIEQITNEKFNFDDTDAAIRQFCSRSPS